MLNIVELSKNQISEINNSKIPQIILEKIQDILTNKIDHILFRKVPVSNIISNTPTEIRDTKSQPKLEKEIFTKVVENLGETSDKEFENTIRFTTSDRLKNEEPWHNHSQHKYSALYCIKEDKASTSYLESANQIIETSDEEMRKLLLSPIIYKNKEIFLIKYNKGIYEFSRDIFGHSYLEKEIDNLDLPDALQKLKKIAKNSATSYLINVLEKSKNKFTYQVGDLVIVNEASTIRFSPAYKPSKSKNNDKWMIAVSIKR